MMIFKANPNDIQQLVNLVNGAYRGEAALQGWTTESLLLDGIRIDEEEMKSYFANPAVTLLKQVDGEGGIVACVYLEKLPGNRLYLGMLTVKPTMQAQGTGKLLLAEAESYAAKMECTAIRISVIPVRHELVAWYKRRGFMPTGEMLPFPKDTRFGIPRQPVELMIMEKTLDS